MKTTRVIACLDVLSGAVVKGVRFENLTTINTPSTLANRYEKQGADEIVFLDIGATPLENKTDTATIEAIRNSICIPLTVGGGIQTMDNARRAFDAGADRISVNSAAVLKPGFIDELAKLFGSQSIVVAVDAYRCDSIWNVAISGGRQKTEIKAETWIAECESRGAGEILLTSVDRDGTGLGYDLNLISRVRNRTSLPVIASGGLKTPIHAKQAVDSGADAILLAGTLHRNELCVADIKNIFKTYNIGYRI